MPDLGETLQELRKERGLKQQDVAAFLNCAPSTVGGYETGKNEPSVDVIISLARLYKVSCDYIFGLTRIQLPVDEIIREFDLHDDYSIANLIHIIDSLTPGSKKTLYDVIDSLAFRDKSKINNYTEM